MFPGDYGQASYGATGPDVLGSFMAPARGDMYPYGQPTMYGVPVENHKRKTFFLPGQRRRLNCVAVSLAFLLPWLLFCGVFALWSSKVHYLFPQLVWVFTGILCLPFLIFAYWGIKEACKKVRKEFRVGTWHIFIALSMLAAVVAGVYLGDLNYNNYCWRGFAIDDLNTYTGVDPNRLRGMMMQDAGRVEFVEHALPVKNLSMGFVNGDTWCVAPFVLPGAPAPATYDFWAVGKNCCSGQQSSDFHCEQFGNPYAHGGLRLLDDGSRGNYRLAVQQAEAIHHIRATHPLFFIQHQDTHHVLEEDRRKCYLFFASGVAGAFVLHAFLVTVTSVIFSKMGTLAWEEEVPA